MGEPRSSTCEPWATEDDLCSPCSPSDADIDIWLQIASDILFAFSGRQFPGHCTDTVRPCARWTGDTTPPRSLQPYAAGWPWYPSWGYCGCNRDVRTGCSPIPAITLGGAPVVSVEAVKVDGTTLDSSAYRIDDYRWLTRIDGQGWPCCQRMDLDDSQSATWSVTYTYGRRPPLGGKKAAAVLACDYAKACIGEPCQLPDRVSQMTRQGVTEILLDPLVLTQNQRTGHKFVDSWLDSVNPDRLRRRGRVIIPGEQRRVRRVGT